VGDFANIIFSVVSRFQTTRVGVALASFQGHRLS
jgi:hypothetical protein